MKQLFDDSEIQHKLGVNKKFSASFDERRRKELLERNKRMQNSSEEDSCSEQEDSEAQLLNDRLQAKFLAHLANLKRKSQELYKTSQNVFKDQDFQRPEKEKVRKNKKVGVRDVIVRDYLQKQQESEQFQDEGAKARDQAKSAFKQAGELPEEQQFLNIKKKSKQQELDEKQQLSKIAEKAASKRQKQLVMDFWADDNNLDEVDKYLRKYILTKGWVDKSKQGVYNEIDQEDEERSLQMDVYEHDYNFRFEEPGGTQIISHPRRIEDSARLPSKSKRAVQSLKKQEHKKSVKQNDILREAKKEQILSRIGKVVAVGRVQDKEAIEEMLEEDWDERQHQKNMSRLFNEDYYQQPEEEQLQELGMQVEGQEQDKDKDNVLLARPSIPIAQKKALRKEDVQEFGNQLGIWYYCDQCLRGIPQFQFRFDCQECPDYTLCKFCREQTQHSHKFRRQQVPEGCCPPSDPEIRQILNGLVICNKCRSKLDQNQRHFEHESQVLCYDCFDELNLKQKKKFKEVQKGINFQKLLQENPEALKQKVVDQKLAQLVDQYNALNYEDILPSGIKTRFKYIETKPQAFGLSDAQLLFAQDQVLNQYVSVKKIAPYRSEKVQVRNQVYRNKIAKIKKSVREGKKQLRQGKSSKVVRTKAVIIEEEERQVEDSRLKTYGL